MNIARGIGRWVCAFGISAVLGAWVLIATIQTTVLDRNVVKGWLAQSGIYANGLNLQIQAASGEGDTSLITPDMLQKALTQTFDAAYIKTNTDTVINSTYDWLEGKAKTITFSIPVQNKAQLFAANLAALVEPKIAALPACNARLGNTNIDHLTCLPPGVKASDYASQLTKPAAGQDQFLSAPLTQDVFKNQSFPQLVWLPSVVQTGRLLTVALPVVAIILAGLYVLASGEDKIRGAGRVGRHVAIGSSLTLIGGLVLWLGSTTIDLSGLVDSGGNPAQTAAVTAIVNPLARTILPDFGRALSLYSGSAVAIGVMLWAGMYIWHRHKRPTLDTKKIPKAGENSLSTDHEKPKELPTPTNAPKAS